MRLWTRFSAVAVLGFALAACASSKDTGFPAQSLVPDEEPHLNCAEITDEPAPFEDEVLVLDNCFAPKVTSVAAGEEVHWVQEGVAPHNVRFVDLDLDSHPSCAEDITTCMAAGDEYTATIPDPGEYVYYCVIHGSADGTGMAGTLIVE